jgi:LysM repeat protein
MRFYTTWRGRAALATAVVIFSLGVSGCFQTADASNTAVPANDTSGNPVNSAPVDSGATTGDVNNSSANNNNTDAAFAPINTIAPDAPQAPVLEPTITPLPPTPQPIAQLETPTIDPLLPGQVFVGGPEATQTAVQQALFAQATAILVGVTQTAAVEGTMTATALGTFEGAAAQPIDPNAQQPVQPQPGQIVITTTPVGVTGEAGSGAAGPIDQRCVYTVVEGDRIFRIALRFGLTVDTLARYNGIVNPELISVEQTLRIPSPGCKPAPTATPTPNPNIPPTATPNPNSPTATPAPVGTTYIVQPGDTLFLISIRTGARISAIAQANNLTNINLIYVGQTLIIP